MTIAQPPSQRTSLLATVISLLVAPVMWFIHFNAAYAVVDFGCRDARDPASLVTMVLIATTVALIPTLLAGIFALRLWRQTGSAPPASDDMAVRDMWERRRFVAFTGVILTAILAVGILVTTMPIFFVPVCEGIVM
jgi:hypothetical protein